MIFKGGEEQFDQLLGDYFRWADESDPIDGAPTSIESFLQANSQWSAESTLMGQLRDFLDETRVIQRVAATTLSHWIDEDESTLGLAASASDKFVALPHEVGDYELLEEVGRGGMGVVYRAYQKSLDRVVCTKMILAGRLAGQRDIERFLAEAKAMANLRHPNIVTVYEVVSHEDQYFYSMEFIPGQTLAAMVKDGPLPATQAANFARSVANAIYFAHEQGVLHRDLKPSNVIVDREATPHVMDFGLSRSIEAGTLTSTGALVGTPSYMAPELTKGDRTAGVACDVYGIGAVLYELITARPPFQGETPLDTLLQVRENEAARPSLLNPRVPRDLETICLKCLSKNPAQRYVTANEVAEELGRFLRHEPIHARPISSLSRFASWCRRNPLPVALAATVFAALLTVSGVLLYANQRLQAEKSNLATAKNETDDANLQLKQQRNRLAETQSQLGDYLSLSRIRRATQAVSHGDLTEVEVALQELQPKLGEPDTRGWEWYYLRAISRQYRTSYKLPSAIRASVALQEQSILALDVTGSLRIVDGKLETDRLAMKLHDTYGCVAWNERKQQIAVGLNNGSVALIEAGDFNRDGSQRIPANAITMVSLGTRQPIRSVGWNRAGTRLACGLDDGTLAVVDTDIGEVVAQTATHSDGINSVSWSHDGQWIATGSDDFTAKLTSWKALHSAQPKAAAAEAAAAEAEPAILAARFNEWVNAVEFAPAELALAIVSRDGQFQVVDFTANDDELTTELRFSRSNARGAEISAVAWSSDGEQLVTSGESADVSTWSAETGQLERQLHGHTQPVRSLSWRDNSVVSAGDDGTVKLWDSDRSPEGQVISDTTAPVRYVTWHPTLPLAAWRDVDGLITVWDNEQRHISTRFAESITSATALTWHPNKPLIALSRNESVLIYDLDDDSALIQLEHVQGDSVWHIRWSPDGKTLATSGAAGKLTFWNVAAAKQIRSYDNLDSVSAFCWSRDGAQLYVVDNKGTINGINPVSGAVKKIRSIANHVAKSIAVSLAGTQLAITTELGQILVVRLVGDEQFSLRGHQGTVWSCVWASDDRRLISGGQDGTIRVWHVDSRQESLRLSTHASAVWSIDMNRGRQLISASSDGTVRLWGKR